MYWPFHRKKKQPLSIFFKSPVFIILIVCLVLMSFNLIAIYKLRPFNSDDVFWQAILLHWHPFEGTLTTLGNSSIYVDKIPFYEFFNHFFEPSRKVLLIEAAINALLGFTGFYLASVYFLKKMKAKLSYVTLLPFVWLAGFGYSFVQLYLNTNWRGFQLGISFAIFALVAAVWYGDIRFKAWWSKLGLLLVTAYAGLQMYSDPYFLYFTIGPLTLLSLILFITKKINKQQFLIVFLPVIVSLLFSKLFAVIFHAAGIRTTMDYPMEFIHFENIADSFSGSIHSIIIIFSSDFFGLPLKNPTIIAPILNFVLLSFISVAVFAFLKTLRGMKWKKLSFDTIWKLFFIGICVLVFGSHTISTLGQGTFTYRYFLLFALVFAFIFSWTLASMKDGVKKNIVVTLLILATLFNLTGTASGRQDAARPDVANNTANILNDTVINTVKARGYTKGYANYWDANISTYLSAGKVSFLPSVCNDHKANKWYWLINDNAFDKKVQKSFYFLNPDVPAACQAKDIDRQFGKATDIVRLGNKTLYFYDYDISSKLGIAKE